MSEELIDDQHQQDIFFDLINNSIDSLLETGENIIKIKKNLEKGFGICPLIDIWFNFKCLQKDYSDVLKAKKLKNYFKRKINLSFNIQNLLFMNLIKCNPNITQFIIQNTKPIIYEFD